MYKRVTREYHPETGVRIRTHVVTAEQTPQQMPLVDRLANARQQLVNGTVDHYYEDDSRRTTRLSPDSLPRRTSSANGHANESSRPRPSSANEPITLQAFIAETPATAMARAATPTPNHMRRARPTHTPAHLRRSRSSPMRLGIPDQPRQARPADPHATLNAPYAHLGAVKGTYFDSVSMGRGLPQRLPNPFRQAEFGGEHKVEEGEREHMVKQGEGEQKQNHAHCCGREHKSEKEKKDKAKSKKSWFSSLPLHLLGKRQ
jgi:hypothetical protein